MWSSALRTTALPFSPLIDLQPNLSTLTKSIFRIKYAKSRSERLIARHQLVYCPNPAYSDAKYHVIKNT